MGVGILWKVVLCIWPFIWELAFGKHVTVKDVLQKDKKRLLLPIIAMLGIIVSLWTTVRLIEVSHELVETKRLLEAARSLPKPRTSASIEDKERYKTFMDELNQISEQENNQTK